MLDTWVDGEMGVRFVLEAPVVVTKVFVEIVFTVLVLETPVLSSKLLPGELVLGI